MKPHCQVHYYYVIRRDPNNSSSPTLTFNTLDVDRCLIASIQCMVEYTRAVIESFLVFYPYLPASWGREEVTLLPILQSQGQADPGPLDAYELLEAMDLS